MDSKLRVLSYNIWFDEYARDERTISLIYNIKIINPDVICLQEVTVDVYEKIKNAFPSYNPYPLELDSAYGCVILSKYSIKKAKIFELTTNMKRALVTTLIEIPITYIEDGMLCYDKKDILITNSHYESEFNKENPTKIKQFKETKDIFNKLLLKYQNIIHCADTNIVNDEEQFYVHTMDGWRDCWMEGGADDNNKFTYDYDTNENLKSRNLNYRGRIDRIAFHETDNLELLKFVLTQGDKKCVQPSDHHGVYADFKVSAPKIVSVDI